MTFRPCPKEGPKPKKKRKWLRRSRIKPGKNFKEQENVFKQYREVPLETLQGWARVRIAEQLRKNPKAERLLAGYLRGMGLSFRRQVPFYLRDRFILADFALDIVKLIIEADGPEHNAEKDRKRDRWLWYKHGYRVLRLPNHTVIYERARTEALVMWHAGHLALGMPVPALETMPGELSGPWLPSSANASS